MSAMAAILFTKPVTVTAPSVADAPRTVIASAAAKRKHFLPDLTIVWVKKVSASPSSVNHSGRLAIKSVLSGI